MKYKDTLNLPSTKFPMKANLSQKELELLTYWKKINLYNEIRNNTKNCNQFILHDGPPYANGDIHIGHAVNKILKDFVIKSKTLSGYDVPFIPGWDCHGLPIELKVEKKFGKSKFKDDNNAFRKACREYANQQIQKQKNDFIRLGINADWENPYLSMDSNFEASIIRSLSQIISNNHVYYGSKPVHWCIESESALAEAEVEYNDITSDAIDVMFKACDCSVIFEKFNAVSDNDKIYFVIWTTTPWTLPANQAIAVGDDIKYSLVKVGNNLLILAKSLVENIINKIKKNEFTIIGECLGKDLVSLKAEHPFYKKQVPVISAPHVTTESGTGLVHIAPGHGQEDYVSGIENNLEIFNPVDGKGKFADSLELFGGLSVRDADEKIIAVLKEKNRLLTHEKYTHSYPHCWRFKTPLIFRATPQWFISMDKNKLREKITNSLSKTEWVPDWGLDRIKNMIESRPDWCISRQRFWGVPIPLFIHRETNELHPKTTEFLKKAASIVQKGGIESWFDYDKKQLLGPDSDSYKTVTDTLDVWFDSGVTHLCAMQARGLGQVADLYLEGSDQHRGWFQSSLITALATIGKPPYKSVLTHGFVVDSEGQKMSKSLGNIISPQEIIKKQGSDILRLWVATTDYTKEMNISEEIIKRTTESYRRLRNTARFLLSNTDDFNASTEQVDYKKMLLLDKWILFKAKDMQNKINKNYESYRFHQIAQDIQNFCTTELGGFYLDIIKDRLYTTQKNSLIRKSCQTACYKLLNMLNLWIAPILSFTAEEIYLQKKKAAFKSVFLEKWIDEEFHLDKDEADLCNLLFELRNTVSKELEVLRDSGEIGSSLDATLEIHADSVLLTKLKKFSSELKFIFITSDCILSELLPNQESRKIFEYNYSITVSKNSNIKCERCWHKDESVGTINKHQSLCSRCCDNVEGKGEARQLG